MADDKSKPSLPSHVSAVVARGRTVVDATGATCKAGESAKLDEADAKRLSRLGFLVRDDQPSVAIQGPKITAADGPSIQRAG
jgi:hypothetical protein